MVSKSLTNVLQRQIRSVGLAISSSELQEKSVSWTQALCDKNRLKPSDVHIVLFNSHNGSMAAKFRERKFTSLCLIESNQEYANLQKEYFMSDSTINTYHASIQDDLLSPPRSKMLKEKFLPRILLPNKGKKLSILIGNFPFLTQQKSIVEAMLNQYLVHARRMSTGRRWEHRLNEVDNQVLPDFYPPKTIFQLANISLLTLLNPLTLCRLICSNDDNFAFFARQHLHFSLLFNICFDVFPLTDRIGFSTSHFSPDMIDFGEISYEQKLDAVGYKKDHYYPVAITPKDPVERFNYYNQISPELDNASVLLELACWLLSTGKFTNSGLVNKQIR